MGKTKDELQKSRVILKPITGFRLSVTTDEKGTKLKTLGYYKDPKLASIDAKGAAFMNSDGNVTEMSLWLGDDGKVYDLKPVEGGGSFVDSDANYKESVLNKIMSKLDADELGLLGLVASEKPKRTRKPKEAATEK